MDNPFKWACRLWTLVVSYLLHLQNLYDYLLPSVTLVNLLWLLPIVCNFFHLIKFNLQAYLIVIAICWQLSSCGREVCPTLEAKQRIVIILFLLKKHITTIWTQQNFIWLWYSQFSLILYHILNETKHQQEDIWKSINRFPLQKLKYNSLPYSPPLFFMSHTHSSQEKDLIENSNVLDNGTIDKFPFPSSFHNSAQPTFLKFPTNWVSFLNVIHQHFTL